METFRIDFTLPDPFPDGKKLGECGEKNAAQLIITPPDNLASREEIRSYVVAFSTGKGPVRYGPVQKSETITVPVGNALTVGSALSVQVEGYDSDGEFVIKSPVLNGIMLSGSIADGSDSCSDGNGKNTVPGHLHDNLDVLDRISEINGVPNYNGRKIILDEEIKTVELLQSTGCFSITTGFPFYGSAILACLEDGNGIPYIPDGAEIVSVEYNLEPEEEPVWIDIRDMFLYEPNIPYNINQRFSHYDPATTSTLLAQVTFFNDNVNSFYDAADNYLVSSLRVRYKDRSQE